MFGKCSNALVKSSSKSYSSVYPSKSDLARRILKKKLNTLNLIISYTKLMIFLFCSIIDFLKNTSLLWTKMNKYYKKVHLFVSLS